MSGNKQLWLFKEKKPKKEKKVEYGQTWQSKITRNTWVIKGIMKPKSRETFVYAINNHGVEIYTPVWYFKKHKEFVK